jgi:hypothetical protein
MAYYFVFPFDKKLRLMKLRHIYLVLVACWSSTCWAQQVLPFSSYDKRSNHYVKAEAKLLRNSDYDIQFDQEFTSMRIKILPQVSLLKSYLLVNGDTIRLKGDELPFDPMQGCQLIVFKTPVARLQLHTQGLFGTVEFHLYNSEAQVMKVPPLGHSAKVPGETLSASLVALDRKEILHRNMTITRHPDMYSKKK